jgi:hypothetical protein
VAKPQLILAIEKASKIISIFRILKFGISLLGKTSTINKKNAEWGAS